MLDGTQSGCINHPGISATVRCKQCLRPVCDSCVVSGPTGRFCSETCKSKNEAFIRNAQQLDGKARGSLGLQLRKLFGLIVMMVVILFVVGAVASFFPIPVVSDLVLKVRNVLGI